MGSSKSFDGFSRFSKACGRLERKGGVAAPLKREITVSQIEI